MNYKYLAVVVFIALFLCFRKENFIGSDMWYGYSFHDSNKTSKEDRLKSLLKIKKGWLPGPRPKQNGLLENFENVKNSYNPKTYEIEPQYHRTIRQFGIDPNPIESLETPEFMIPKTYRTLSKYEELNEVSDNVMDLRKLKGLEAGFKNAEKNKYYADLLKSQCRAGNRSDAKNCGCSKPFFGEH